MNINIHNVILILLSSAFFVVSSYQSTRRGQGLQLSDADSFTLGQLISAGDHPQALASIWGNHVQLNLNRCKPHLCKMIRLNRIESFKFLYPRLDFSRDRQGQWTCSLMVLSAIHKRREIFDFLVEQNRFQANRFLNNLNFEFVSCLSPRNTERGLAIIEVALRVADANQQVRNRMVSLRNILVDWLNLLMSVCSCLERGLLIIDAAELFASMFEGVVNRVGLYGSLMEALLRNRHLCDEDKASLLNRLLECGLEINAANIVILVNAALITANLTYI